MTEAKEQQVASEMVERVAAVLYERCCCFGLPWGGASEQYKNRSRELARAVMAAMRDLPPSVVKAGIEADDKRTGYQTILHIHRAMIDAALSGSSVGHQTSRCAPVLSSAAISDAANAERLLEPTLGPEANT
jgi:hypothetical protein